MSSTVVLPMIKIEELKRQVPFIFSDYSMDTERIMRITKDCDNGFVGIDFVLTIPQIRALLVEAADIIEAVYSSEHLIIHENKKIRRRSPFRFCSNVAISINGDEYLEAIKKNQYITAKGLWRIGRCGADNEKAKVEVIRKMTFEMNNTLYKLLHYKTLYAQLRELNEEKSFMLLLWTVFPRLLMLFPDMIHAPLVFERPYWDLSEFLDSIQGLDGTVTDAYTEMPQQDYPHAPGVLCTFYGVTDQGARILASALCSPRIIVVHDQNGMVWIKDISLSGPKTTCNHRTTYRIVPPSEQEDITQAQRQIRRTITAADMAYLRQLWPPICNRTYINWEFYCRELLGTIERLSGTLVDQVSEMENTDYPLQEGVLCTYYGISAEGARQFANAFCSSRVIVVYDKELSALYIKDVTLSGPQKLAYFHTTYRIGPTLSHCQGLPNLQQERLRTITDNELAYLKQLRWKDRKLALLVAARCRNGINFHVLKLVANFI